MTAYSYIGLGFAVMVITATIQYMGWVRIGARGLRSADADTSQGALRRWMLFVVLYQAVVLTITIGYVVICVHSHVREGAWPAPAIGAVIGTALPLQMAVMGIARAAR